MFKKYSLLLLICASWTYAAGQAANSPFSKFGIGEPYGNALINNQGMGTVGIGNPQYVYLNNQNPALLVYNYLTNLGAGFIGEQRTIKSGKASEKNSNGNLSYLTMAFPVIGRGAKSVTNRWSSSLGLMPYSTVNYKLNYTSSLEGTSNTLNTTESGSGGMNQVFWSNGITISKNISVGIKSRYLFGSRIDEYLHFVSQAPVYQPNVYERQQYSDFNFTTGFAFHTDSLFAKNYRFNIGLVYDFKSNIKTTYFSRLERRSGNSIIDSVTIVNDKVGNTVLPPSLGGGISFGRRSWTVGADVVYTDYKQFKDYFDSNPATQNTMHYAVGGEFTPNTTSASNYLGRITYRGGLSYDDFPYLLGNGSAVKDVGINVGLALPVGGISSLDIAFKVGRRGDLKINGVAEDYFKIYFGATFNDRWFIKRRFD